MAARERVQLVWEATLRGKFPDIPLPDDITAEDFGESPMFVTLPIMPVNARSRNERTYTRPAVESIVRQVNEKRPNGFWGHLPVEEYSTRYDVPAVRWLAATIEDGMAWGKLVAITPDAREHFRVAKAANASVGTSIYGWGEMDGDNVVSLDLESIDLADPSRVGILAAVAVPVVTAEMVKGEDMATLQELQTERDTLAQRVAELERERDTLAQQVTEQRDYGAIAGEFTTYFGEGADAAMLIKSIYEALLNIQQSLGLEGRISVNLVDVQRMVGEMAVERQQRMIADTVAAVIPHEPLREFVRGMLGDVKDSAAVSAKVESIMAGAAYQALAKAIVTAEMGPSAIVTAHVGESDKRKAEMDKIEAEARQTAAGLWGGSKG